MGGNGAMEMGPVNYVALAVLILMGLYVLSLIYNNFRAAGLSSGASAKKSDC